MRTGWHDDVILKFTHSGVFFVFVYWDTVDTMRSFFFTTFLCSVFVTPAANDTSSFRSCFWAIVVNNENKQSAIDVQNDTFVYRVTPFKVALVWTLWWLKLELKGAQRGSPCPSTETTLQLNEQPFLVGGCDVYSISVSGKTFSR